MPVCEKCNKSFPNRVKIEGKTRVLKNRKYCLECSPFNKHNTKKINGKPRKDQMRPHKCSCGESDPDKFYGNKRSSCGKCHNKYTKKKGKEKRKRAIDLLGGCCKLCGYNKCYEAIDLHHLKPEEKEVGFSLLKGWSWEKIEKAIKKCVPLCSNCHREVHAGITKIE